jgi:hypothetical protein
MHPPSQDQRVAGVGRRQFLKRLGIGAIGVGAASMASAIAGRGFRGTGAEAVSIDVTLPGRFGRCSRDCPRLRRRTMQCRRL